ncbi:MAG: isopenicillin N synthase family oxygenase [Burkholderiales bacterium]|nr:isopenicillin N synthase family oxygenase [Burkholderiales bacterium]
MNVGAVPIIDLGPAAGGGLAGRMAVAREIDAACRATGFFQIVNHGVPPAQCEAILESARAFFAMPMDAKLEVAMSRSPANRGYEPLGGQTLEAGTAPDLKESFYIGRDLDETDPYVRKSVPNHGPNQWPAGLPGFRTALEDAHAELLWLGKRMMRLFALALGMPECHFDRFVEAPMALLRLLHYPPLPADGAPARLGAGAHTDWGALTLLLQDSVGGLEVRGPDDLWLPVPPVAGALVVNIGDMMQRWTNDRYRSTLHRVRNNDSGRDRYSAPMFIDLNFFARVECLPTCTSADEPPRYAPCTAGEHIAEMYRRTYG